MNSNLNKNPLIALPKTTARPSKPIISITFLVVICQSTLFIFCLFQILHHKKFFTNEVLYLFICLSDMVSYCLGQQICFEGFWLRLSTKYWYKVYLSVKKQKGFYFRFIIMSINIYNSQMGCQYLFLQCIQFFMSQAQLNVVSSLEWSIPQNNLSLPSYFAQKLKKELQYMDLGNGKWDSQNIETTIANLKIWNLKRTLFLGKNLKPSILISIKNIQFPFLTRLCLNHNNISSVECMSSMKMPSLKELDLQSNRFRSLKNIRKGKWKSIALINIVNNPIVDYDGLCELQTRLVTWIGLDTMASNECPDVKWLAKLQANNLKSIDLQNRKRIKIQIWRQKMRGKYRKLQI